jgi:hypothetical protein
MYSGFPCPTVTTAMTAINSQTNTNRFVLITDGYFEVGIPIVSRSELLAAQHQG